MYPAAQDPTHQLYQNQSRMQTCPSWGGICGGADEEPDLQQLACSTDRQEGLTNRLRSGVQYEKLNIYEEFPA